MGELANAIGEPAMYELMAEDCNELAKACLKKARIIRGENPTPLTTSEADVSIMEEWSDVILCAREMRLRYSEAMIHHKTKRWTERMNQQQALQSLQPLDSSFNP